MSVMIEVRPDVTEREQIWHMKEQLEVYLNTMESRLKSMGEIYPVGSIYMSVNSTDPSALFGGVWERIEDRFLLSAGSTYAAGATGGEATVILTASQSGVPKHTHTFTQPSVTGGALSGGITGGGHKHTLGRATRNNSGTTTTYGYRTESGLSLNDSTETQTHTHNLPSHSHTVSGGAVGNNTAADATSAHNNMPPYLAVYCWKRIA